MVDKSTSDDATRIPHRPRVGSVSSRSVQLKSQIPRVTITTPVRSWAPQYPFIELVSLIKRLSSEESDSTLN